MTETIDTALCNEIDHAIKSSKVGAAKIVDRGHQGRKDTREWKLHLVRSR